MSSNWVHIGLPKTGTTSLQENYFPLLPMEFICGHSPHSVLSREDLSVLRYVIIDGHDLEYQKYLPAAQKIIDNINAPFLFSEEGISASIFNDQRVIAERLKTMSGENTKILIVLREQVDMLQSMYAQSSLGFSRKTQAFTFSEYVDAAIEEFTSHGSILKNKHVGKLFTIERLCYDRYAKIYSDVFGKENVQILTFENLFKKKDLKPLEIIFGTKPADDFLKKQEKVSSSYIDYQKNICLGTTGFGYFKRYYWSIVGKMGLYKDKSIKDAMTLNAAQKQQLEDIFSPRNNWLNNNFDLGLEKQGYIL